ncbi:MAG: flagellar hook-basal body complex protein FliE [Armatimonadota bacterium]|nr:flagellar hook-basal body complex protein FliE [Armatimonadota bacterium]MDR7439041.1 flagellar hook-basal body complex protein FliE [Armatimonadota bacterium]MDR7562477.1 flagellar hook-basal body complex protein FliE [Armatimonadota bacterium]MDR7566833.1 flagellar hook-basal body complex protein FliE [Armatimonadota bacterium]MDR7601190.1 flagellar hook-basal body complex protein FliE [Armatimonadota bacterium]
MDLRGVGPLTPVSVSPLRETLSAFAEALERAVRSADELQRRADAAATALADGRTDDVHAVMVAMEEANLALQLAIQVRNRLLEAYQELIRMQV